jgi:uncharacterized LabA/DUF88 family protein
MIWYAEERTALFIDGSSLYNTSRNLEFDVDYKKLLDYFEKNTALVRASYYSAIVENTDEYSPLKPLTDWLGFNGYALITKPAKQFTDKVTGKIRIRGNMNVEIAVDMIELAMAGNKIEHMVLFSSDPDLRRAVEAVQRQGVRVTIVSSTKVLYGIPDELRRQGDRFVELTEISGDFTRRKTEPRIRRDYTEIDTMADV